MARKLIKFYAKSLEYEHALEHILECPETSCSDCKALAQGALAGDNKKDFIELAQEFSFPRYHFWKIINLFRREKEFSSEDSE